MITSVLLQMSYQGFQKGGSAALIYIILAALAGFIIVIILVNRGQARKKAIKSGKPPAAYKKKIFRRKARSMGLSKPHVDTLEHLVQRHNVKNPFSLLQNAPLLDIILKRGMKDISEQVANEPVKEAQRLTLFHIKQIIERNSQKKTVYATTRQLRANQKIVLAPETGGRFETLVLSVLKDSFGVTSPKDGKGVPQRWRKWMPVKAYFWKENGQGYSFNTKAIGYNTLRGKAGLLLQHTNSITQSQQRKYRRKDIDKPAYFYKIRIATVGTGKDAVKKAIVDGKGSSLGTLLDISAGGCSLKTNYPFIKGELIKVEFETTRRVTVTVFGKVKGVRRLQPVGGVMHIMFTRVSRQNLNKINAFVYDLEDAAPERSPAVSARGQNRSTYVGGRTR